MDTIINKSIVLDNIIDEITIESAQDLCNEYTCIMKAYVAMSNIDNALLTTETANNDFDNYVTNQLESIGLTKEYFGFSDNLTIESAQITIEVDDRWNKLWLWLKEKIQQIKEWLLKIFSSLFNKNKSTAKIIDDLIKVNLKNKKQNTLSNSTFTNIINYLPDYSECLLDYAKNLKSNFDNYSSTIDTIIKNDVQFTKNINELKASEVFRKQSEMSIFLGHRVYTIYGLLLNITEGSAKYLTIDGSSKNKIINNSYVITGTAKPNGVTTVLNKDDIDDVLLALKDVTKSLDNVLSLEGKKLKSLLTVYTDSIKINTEEVADILRTVVDIMMGRQVNINFTLNEITKLVKVISLHMKCYDN